MARRLLCAASATLLLASAGLAQKWEAGGAAGGGFYRNLAVTNPAGNATAGLGNGPVFGGYVGHHPYRYMSGELRYSFSAASLKVSGNGEEACFKGQAHAVHYDYLFHAGGREARVRPFAAVGGGVKIFRGTGVETAYQNLQNFALLTRTRQVMPLISVGGGTRIALSPRVWLRVEFRDQITPFPKEVVAPAPGARIKGWLHDFVPMAGVGLAW
ncbi:MAG: hypothetical protein IT158_25075 [Bryobacterales bacterium]|nr:hypothetical protein [Bryobacterales bacterium]